MQLFRLEHGAGWRSVVSGGFLRHLMIACWCNRCQSSWRYPQKHQVWGSGSYTLHVLVSFRYLLVFIVVLNLETLFLLSQHVLIVSTRWNFTMVLSFAPDSSCRLLSYSSIYVYIFIDTHYIWYEWLRLDALNPKYGMILGYCGMRYRDTMSYILSFIDPKRDTEIYIVSTLSQPRNEWNYHSARLGGSMHWNSKNHRPKLTVHSTTKFTIFPQPNIQHNLYPNPNLHVTQNSFRSGGASSLSGPWPVALASFGGHTGRARP